MVTKDKSIFRQITIFITRLIDIVVLRYFVVTKCLRDFCCEIASITIIHTILVIGFIVVYKGSGICCQIIAFNAGVANAVVLFLVTFQLPETQRFKMSHSSYEYSFTSCLSFLCLLRYLLELFLKSH